MVISTPLGSVVGHDTLGMNPFAQYSRWNYMDAAVVCGDGWCDNHYKWTRDAELLLSDRLINIACYRLTRHQALLVGVVASRLILLWTLFFWVASCIPFCTGRIKPVKNSNALFLCPWSTANRGRWEPPSQRHRGNERSLQSLSCEKIKIKLKEGSGPYFRELLTRLRLKKSESAGRRVAWEGGEKLRYTMWEKLGNIRRNIWSYLILLRTLFYGFEFEPKFKL